MRMSEGFAATVAAVAPVVLLVAVVEVNNARPRLREAHDRLREQVDPLKAAVREGRALTEAEAAALQRSYWKIALQVTRNLLFTVYFSAYVALALGLAVVEYVALEWLATPDVGPQEDNASLCLYLGAGSFAWIILPGVGAINAFMSKSLWLQRQGAWALIRLEHAQTRRSRDDEAEA